MCPEDACRTLDFDRQLLAALHAWQRPWLDAFFVAATWLGSILVLLPLALAAAWRLWRDGRPGSALFPPLAAAAVGISSLVWMVVLIVEIGRFTLSA